MDNYFRLILQMSFSGSIAILLVILLRAVFKKTSKKVSCLMWLVAFIRLICPYNFKSALSILNLKLFNKYATISNISNTAPIIKTANKVTNPIKPAVTAHNNSIHTISNNVIAKASTINPFTIMSIIWITVFASLVFYTALKTICTMIKLRDSERTSKYIYETDKISSPFVFGFFRPRIYMPIMATRSEQKYLLLHEKTHIKNCDHISKLLALIIMFMHWFNPLVWLAFLLMSNDIEMRCDEEVIDTLGVKSKKDYGIMIVSYATMDTNNYYNVLPISFARKSFGGYEAKSRVHNLFRYKNTSKITLAIFMIVCISTVTLLTANAQDAKQSSDDVVSENVVNVPVADVTAKTIQPLPNASTSTNTTMRLSDNASVANSVETLPDKDTTSKDTLPLQDNDISTESSVPDNSIETPTGMPGVFHVDIPDNLVYDDEQETNHYDFRDDPDLYNTLCQYASEGYTISYVLSGAYTDDEAPEEYALCVPHVATATRDNEDIYFNYIDYFSIDYIKEAYFVDNFDSIEETDRTITLTAYRDYTLDGSSKLKEQWIYDKNTQILCSVTITPNDREYTVEDFYDFTKYDYTTNETLVKYAKLFEDQGFIAKANTESVIDWETCEVVGEVYIKDSCYCYRLDESGCNNEDVYIYIVNEKFNSIDEIISNDPLDYISCREIISSTELENGYKINTLNEEDGSELEIFYYPDDNIYIIHRLEGNGMG